MLVHRLSICIGSDRLELHSLVCLNVLRSGFHVYFGDRLRLSDNNSSSTDSVVRSLRGSSGSSAATAADDNEGDDGNDWVNQGRMELECAINAQIEAKK